MLPGLDLHRCRRLAVLGSGVKHAWVPARRGPPAQSTHSGARLQASSRCERRRPRAGPCEYVVAPRLQVGAAKFTEIVGLRAADDTPCLSSLLDLLAENF